MAQLLLFMTPTYAHMPARIHTSKRVHTLSFAWWSTPSMANTVNIMHCETAAKTLEKEHTDTDTQTQTHKHTNTHKQVGEQTQHNASPSWCAHVCLCTLSFRAIREQSNGKP